MTDLAGSAWRLSAANLVIALLVVGSLGHVLSLMAARRRWSGWQMTAAALAQGALLLALGGAIATALATSVPSGWLPTSAGDTVRIAADLALLVYLVAGGWWRSPGCGVALPAVIASLLAVGEAASAAAITRGLPIAATARPWVGLALAATLAVVALALAGQAGRWLELTVLGAARLDTRVLAALLSLAAGLLTVVVALGAWGWFERGRALPAWTVQQTWLAATWLTLLVAAQAAWRARPTRPWLALAGAGLLVVSVAIVSGL